MSDEQIFSGRIQEMSHTGSINHRSDNIYRLTHKHLSAHMLFFNGSSVSESMAYCVCFRYLGIVTFAELSLLCVQSDYSKLKQV